MPTRRLLACGAFSLIVLVWGARDALAQCAVTISVDGGASMETLTGSCNSSAHGLHTLGPIRVQRYDWFSTTDASGGFLFEIKAQFMNDDDPAHLNHTITLTQTASLPGGARQWFSTYSGEGHETPGPSGTAPDGRTFITPNHMDSSVGGTPVGNFDFPIDITPSPVAAPFDGHAGPVIANGAAGGVLHINATLGRGEVLNIQDTATLSSPPPGPTLSTVALVTLVAMLGATGCYLLQTREA